MKEMKVRGKVGREEKKVKCKKGKMNSKGKKEHERSEYKLGRKTEKSKDRRTNSLHGPDSFLRS
jgi:hypothetical protein